MASNTGIAIFVIDSGSTDGTVGAIADIPGVRLLDAGKDAWWSEAVNLGIKLALSEEFQAILLMNDDIDFEVNLVEQMVAKHNQFPHAIITPLQLTPSGPFLGARYLGPLRQPELIRYASTDITVESSNGCCLLVPREAFSSVGLIDEKNCPHLYGDNEFQLRAAQAGYSTLGCPSLTIRQLEATDHYSRVRTRTMFRFKGSPLKITAYWQFGSTLFRGWHLFLIFGVYYHFGYLKGVLRTILRPLLQLR
jgi:GT2 family glycosyltransferase